MKLPHFNSVVEYQNWLLRDFQLNEVLYLCLDDDHFQIETNSSQLAEELLTYWGLLQRKVLQRKAMRSFFNTFRWVT